MDLVFKWNRPVVKIISEKTGGRDGQLFLANTAARFMDPYVPADNLVLTQNIDITADNEKGAIHYLSPYAHYQWEGEFWSRSGIAKVPSGRPLQYSDFRHPLATSHWDKAMITARKHDLAEALNKYLKGRG